MSEKVKVSCLSCGVTNNFPLEEKGKKVVCGICKNALPVPGEVLEPSPSQVLTLLSRAKLPVLIDFFSETCAPCRMMHPIVERLAKRRQGEIMAVKLNVDLYPQVAAQFGIKAVPTFVVAVRGNIRKKATGAMSETDFSLWVASTA